jgi:hypothetical protein
MPCLHDLQRAFAACLLGETESAVCDQIAEDGFTAAERLGIYRNSCRSTLTQALRMTYPAVERLVGPDFFDMAAARFIDEHPAQSGYLNEYGGEFAQFLAAFAPASGLPYLADVARLEWALSNASNAEDVPALTARMMAAIDPACHAALCFEPHPSLRLLTLAYPADRIADAVLSGDDAAMAQVDLSEGPVWLAVHRGPDGIEVQRFEPDAYGFIARLCGREPLGGVLETAPKETPVLLAQVLTRGVLTGIQP